MFEQPKIFNALKKKRKTDTRTAKGILERAKTISYNELQERLLSIKKTRDRAFLCLVYGTVARVGEIVKHKTITERNPPIKKEQIFFDEKKQKLYVTILTEKTMVPRKVIISGTPRETTGEKPWGEKWLVDEIKNWVLICKTNELFPITTRQGRKIFFKHFPEYNQHIHMLRHWRTTHLLSGEVTGNLVPRQAVSKLGGWTSFAPMDKFYDQTITEEYEHLI